MWRYDVLVSLQVRVNHKRGSEHLGDEVQRTAVDDVFEGNPGSVGSRSCIFSLSGEKERIAGLVPEIGRAHV